VEHGASRRSLRRSPWPRATPDSSRPLRSRHRLRQMHMGFPMPPQRRRLKFSPFKMAPPGRRRGTGIMMATHRCCRLSCCSRFICGAGGGIRHCRRSWPRRPIAIKRREVPTCRASGYRNGCGQRSGAAAEVAASSQGGTLRDGFNSATREGLHRVRFPLRRAQTISAAPTAHPACGTGGERARGGGMKVSR